MNRFAAAIAARRGPRRYGLAAMLGILAAGALPPVGLLPLLILSFTGLAWLLDGVRRGREAFAIGWAFGFGYFAAGLHWIVYPFLVDAGRFGWMIPFAIVLLPGGLALFAGFSTWLARLLHWQGPWRIASLAVAWTALEWVRGHVFTGFPWNLVGYAWADVLPVLQAASVLGIYGLSLVSVFAAAAPAALAQPGREGGAWRWAPVAGAVLGFAAIAVLGGLRLAQPGQTDEPVGLRIVQANIPQELKWVREQRERNVLEHVELSRSPGWESRDLVIWPETASTFPIEDGTPIAQVVARAAPPGGFLIAGAPRIVEDPGRVRVFNSMVALNGAAEVVAAYDKQHLVPFGEYLPFRGVLARFGLDKLVQGSANDFSAGEGLATIDLPGLPRFSPLICYEAIFPGAVALDRVRPAWLLSLTNDAWFGPNAGPAQHFAMARVRAVEEGLPLVRAANTGISGVIDPWGRVLARLGPGETGVLDTALPAPLAPTVYARFGDLVAFTLAGIGLLLLVAGRVNL